jgi:arginyl-tRNA synthetase
MVFEAARRAGYLPDGVEATHVSFGFVLGSDGKPFKTRAGDTIRLIDLLDAAISRSAETIRDRGGNLDESRLQGLSGAVGIGAVKYADLSTSRTRDYRFDLQRMLFLQGNTGVYLQYVYARIQSILRRAGGSEEELPPAAEAMPLVPAERGLILLLDDFDNVLRAVEESYEPHRLCRYLYSLAQAFTAFYEQCSVLKAPTPSVRAYRLAMCELTARTLRLGLELLGIRTPERL